MSKKKTPTGAAAKPRATVKAKPKPKAKAKAKQTRNRTPRISPMRQRFLEHYVIHGDARAAARHAGYKGTDQAMWNRASECLANPLVAEKVAEARLKVQAASFATAADKRRMLMDVAERCMQEVSPEVDSEGNATGEFKFDSRAVIAAIAELNKMDGDHAAIKTDLNINESVAGRLEAALQRGTPAVGS